MGPEGKIRLGWSQMRSRNGGSAKSTDAPSKAAGACPGELPETTEDVLVIPADRAACIPTSTKTEESSGHRGNGQ